MSVAIVESMSQQHSQVGSESKRISILERISLGEPDAVDDCLRRYGDLVWTIAKKMLRNSSDAEDATQEIFLELWKSASRFDPSKSAESTFVTMIARRKIVDRVRRTGSSLEMEAYSPRSVEISESCPAQTAEIADEAEKAKRCLRKLSNEQRSVLKMSVYEGASHSQISQLLSMPLGTVKSFARRALLQMRDCMARSETFSDLVS